MITVLPSLYKPTQPEHFLGPARNVALTVQRLVANVRADGSPLKVVLLGPPGTGKSALGDFIGAQLGATRWSTHKFNGTELKIERVEELARSLAYTDLFGDYRLIRVEEVDNVPSVAQVRLLTVLDDLPARCAVVCTSNCKLKDLEKRFQSRFIFLDVQGPGAEELAAFLATHWPALPADARKNIATFACGNVRQALLDADLALAA